MVDYKKGDFIRIDYDLWVSDRLIQTTNKELGEKNNLQGQVYSPKIIILGNNMILDKVDNLIIEGKTKETLDLTPKDAFGNKDKDKIKTFPTSTFEEHKIKPVVGIVYNFNGQFGTIKSVDKSRVLVDFNHLLAGKQIKINYAVCELVKEISTKITFILEYVLQLPKEYYAVKISDKVIEINLPKEIAQINEVVEKQLKSFISELKDYTFEITNTFELKVPQK